MHAHTHDCPVTCLKPLLSPVAYGLLRSECALICGDQEPSVGHAVSLYQKGQLATVRYVGPQRLAEIETCLTREGLIEPATEPAEKPGTAGGDGQPPPVPSGWSGSTRPSGLRTRLFVE